LILAGDSAGGNLTLSLLYVIRQVRLEKERSELQKHRERRLSLSASGGGSFTTRSVDNQQHQRQREWEKGPVERWIEKEREREEVVTSEAVEKVLQTRRQQQKSKESGDSGDDDAAEADKTSEQRWPASDMTESQHRAWERRTLASDDKFMSKHQLPFELADDERDVFPPTPLAAVLLSPWVDLRFVPRRTIVRRPLNSLTRHDTTRHDTTRHDTTRHTVSTVRCFCIGRTRSPRSSGRTTSACASCRATSTCSRRTIPSPRRRSASCAGRSGAACARSLRRGTPRARRTACGSSG
jgi:hypothetical protein